MHILLESSLSTSFSHPSYHPVASVNNLIRQTLPTVINLIVTDDSDQFGVRILRTLNEFIRRLFIILTIVGEYRPAKQFLTEMIAMGLECEFFCCCLCSSFRNCKSNYSEQTRGRSGIAKSHHPSHQPTITYIPGNRVVVHFEANNLNEKIFFFHHHQRITDEVAPEVQQFLVVSATGLPANRPAESSASPQVNEIWLIGNAERKMKFPLSTISPWKQTM